MARSTITIDASPERVWEVLADPDAYGEWVVGTSAIHERDPEFPLRGATFRHTLGVGPLKLSDQTTVLRSEPARRLVLRAELRPVGTSTVDLRLRPVDGSTEVTLIQDPGDPLTFLAFTPLTHLWVRLRNTEGLRRLKRLVER